MDYGDHSNTSVQKIRKMALQQTVNGLILHVDDTPGNHPCPGCTHGKMTCSRSKSGRTRATWVGQLMHRYFVLFTDYFSGCRTVYFLKQKSEVADIFQEFTNHLRTETGQQVHTLRADNEGEFTGQPFRKWLSHNGIRFKTSAPHTLEQNGVSEKANRTIMEATRGLIHSRNIPLELLGEAIACAVSMLNHVPTKTAPNTPYQTGFKLNRMSATYVFSDPPPTFTCPKLKEETLTQKVSPSSS